MEQVTVALSIYGTHLACQTATNNSFDQSSDYIFTHISSIPRQKIRMDERDDSKFSQDLPLFYIYFPYRYL